MTQDSFEGIHRRSHRCHCPNGLAPSPPPALVSHRASLIARSRSLVAGSPPLAPVSRWASLAHCRRHPLHSLHGLRSFTAAGTVVIQVVRYGSLVHRSRYRCHHPPHCHAGSRSLTVAVAGFTPGLFQVRSHRDRCHAGSGLVHSPRPPALVSRLASLVYRYAGSCRLIAARTGVTPSLTLTVAGTGDTVFARSPPPDRHRTTGVTQGLARSLSPVQVSSWVSFAHRRWHRNHSLVHSPTLCYRCHTRSRSRVLTVTGTSVTPGRRVRSRSLTAAAGTGVTLGFTRLSFHRVAQAHRRSHSLAHCRPPRSSLVHCRRHRCHGLILSHRIPLPRYH